MKVPPSSTGVSATRRPRPATSTSAYDMVDTPVGDALRRRDRGGPLQNLVRPEPERVVGASRARSACASVRAAGRWTTTRRQLDEYFEQRRTEFDLAIDMRTRRRLLAPRARRARARALRRGDDVRRTRARAERPRAARAVGTVMNRNPIPIVLPCHRVVGASGSLIGYGGGLDRKEALLRLEGAIL